MGSSDLHWQDIPISVHGSHIRLRMFQVLPDLDSGLITDGTVCSITDHDGNLFISSTISIVPTPFKILLKRGPPAVAVRHDMVRTFHKSDSLEACSSDNCTVSWACSRRIDIYFSGKISPTYAPLVQHLLVLSGHSMDLTHFFISLLTSILSEYCNDTIIMARKRFRCIPKALFRCFIWCISYITEKILSLCLCSFFCFAQVE